MKRPPHPILALLLAAWLAACGPGTGGTGTGETAANLAAFDARAADLCQAIFAVALDCPAHAPGSLDAPSAGSRRVLFADLEPVAGVTVEIEGHAIGLQARCRNLVFSGDWGITGTEDARFFGTYGTLSSAERSPASLSVQAAGDGRLSVAVRAADGKLLLGPVTLQRVSRPPETGPGCG